LLSMPIALGSSPPSQMFLCSYTSMAPISPTSFFM
jgi:hypothetical protein